jgi:pentatricopeptide repeat protein
MQPFLSRSSRTTGPSSTLSNVVLSTTKSTVTARQPLHTSADHGRASLLFRRFGGFYKRFYSAMSENLAPADNERGDICGSGSIVRGASDHTEERPIHAHQGSEAKAAVKPGRSRRSKPPAHKVKGPRYTFPIMPFKYTQGGSDEQGEGSGRPRSVKIHPDQDEASVYRLVRRIQDHDRLIRALEREIGRRSMLLLGALSPTETEVHTKELGSLQKVYAHITMHYYDTKIVGLVMKAVQASQARVVKQPQWLPRPYLPPFPHYSSPEAPTPLNKSLLNLFHPRVPPPRLLLKISYNLLTSTSAPDVKTYNILIRGFTILRQNSLAHMVFRSMVDRGLSLDDYSVAAIINLSVKSADYQGYRQIMRILQRQSRVYGDQIYRSRMALEAMINGAAKFGHVQRTKLLIRVMRRRFPRSRQLSLFLLTSLLRLQTQKGDWHEGRKTWQRMKTMDRIAQAHGKSLVTDLRAYRQMYYLCRACGKREAAKAMLQQAKNRGWVVDDVLMRPEKTKGMHFTSEVKVPRLALLTQMYGRHTWQKKRGPLPPDDSRQRKSLGGVLERAFEDPVLFPSVFSITKTTPQDVPEDRFLEQVLLPAFEESNDVKEDMPEPPEPPAPRPDEERSKLWADILMSRLHILQTAVVPPPEALDSEANGQEPSPPDPEEASGYKPDLVAYTRGCE